jgi:Heparinase II/III-like protein
LDSAGRKLTVVDSFDALAPIPMRLSWHLGPDIDVTLSERRATLSWHAGNDRRHGTMLLPEGLVWSINRANVDPFDGWYSPRFGMRLPATSLVGRGTAASSTRYVTELELP